MKQKSLIIKIDRLIKNSYGVNIVSYEAYHHELLLQNIMKMILMTIAN